MVGQKSVALLSLLVLLMLVSGEEELIRVKRLHNDDPALSSKVIIQPPAGDQNKVQPDKGQTLPISVALADDEPFPKISLDTKGGSTTTRNPLKPLSSNTAVGRIKKRIKRMAEEASLLKRGITHLLGRGAETVIDGERLKREKRPVMNGHHTR
eukprot:XP_011676613.1 PREDICTED: uncharacterized protein LOC105444287 [Strongylocentrotus purpuratus]